ncbi:MAG: nucleoside 2-deoxyribosyltransferase [Candidatus Saccharimonadales bacterium]
MKSFLAYRSTGEDPEVIKPLLSSVREVFRNKGIDMYATFFDDKFFLHKDFSKRQIMDHALKTIEHSDFLFVLVTSDKKSEGMLMEIGFCLAKSIPIVVAIKDDVKDTYIPEIAQTYIRWSDTENLIETIKNYNFNQIEARSS